MNSVSALEFDELRHVAVSVPRKACDSAAPIAGPFGGDNARSRGRPDHAIELIDDKGGAYLAELFSQSNA